MEAIEPQIFLENIQSILSERILPGYNAKEEELIRILNDRNHKFNIEIKPNLSNLPVAVKSLKEILNKHLPIEYTKEINKHIAIGCLQSGEINAACIKQNHKDVYAIIINQGLMIYLNKLIKYFIGAGNIAEIEYCNRLDICELNKDLLISYALELAQIYNQYRFPYGPIIMLKESMWPTHSTYLYIGELFILCHELGHYFNGDLKEDTNFIPFLDIENIIMFNENQNHHMEYLADIKGFELMCFVLEKENLNKPEIILPALIQVFNGLWFLSPEASDTHPDAISRILNLSENFYGKTFSDRLKDSYANPEIMQDKSFFVVN